MPTNRTRTSSPSPSASAGSVGRPQSTSDGGPLNAYNPEQDERLDQEAADAPQRHPNRNLNKPSIDKPTYS